MSGKRRATSDLNHDNWNHEEEPEDSGTFQRASERELKKRVIKTARRRRPIENTNSDGAATRSAFANFTALSKPSPLPPPSGAFSFLSNIAIDGNDEKKQNEGKDSEKSSTVDKEISGNIDERLGESPPTKINEDSADKVTEGVNNKITEDSEDKVTKDVNNKITEDSGTEMDEHTKNKIQCPNTVVDNQTNDEHSKKGFVKKLQGETEENTVKETIQSSVSTENADKEVMENSDNLVC